VPIYGLKKIIFLLGIEFRNDQLFKAAELDEKSEYFQESALQPYF
jgi:hypothetical protein